MISILLIAFVTLFVPHALGEICGCPSFILSNQPSPKGNRSYTATWKIVPQGGNCQNFEKNDKRWRTFCHWKISCSDTEGSLIFRELAVRVIKGGGVRVTNFSIWNPNINAALYTIRGSDVIPPTLKLTRDIIITAKSKEQARIYFDVNSFGPLEEEDFEVEAFMNFMCSRISWFEGSTSKDERDFWTSGRGSLLIVAIIVIAIVALIIRFATGRFGMILRAQSGFAELEDDVEEPSGIKEHSGGATWHEHADEVLLDNKIRANVYENNGPRGEEMDEFSGANALPPPKDEGGESEESEEENEENEEDGQEENEGDAEEDD